MLNLGNFKVRVNFFTFAGRPRSRCQLFSRNDTGDQRSVDSSQSSVAGSQTSGCKLQVAPSFFASNRTKYANGGSDACAFRVSHYSTNVRHCCMVRRNFNLGEGKGGWFYMVMGACRLFQGKFGWGISGERVRLGLDNVYPAEPGTGHLR